MKLLHRRPLNRDAFRRGLAFFATSVWLCRAAAASSDSVVDGAIEVQQRLESIEAVIDYATVEQYLVAWLNRLFPEVDHTWRVRILAHPDANAFALADGTVYVYSGLFARVYVEAELLGILAHEGAHVALSHPTGEANRDIEAAADAEARERLRAVGIDPAFAAGFFRRLEVERASKSGTRRTISGTHLPLTERYRTWLGGEEAADPPRAGGAVEPGFLEMTREVRLVALRQLLERQEVSTVLSITDQPQSQLALGAMWDVFRAEALRLRNQRGDLDEALRLYAGLRHRMPAYTEALYRLGEIHALRHEWRDAEAAFLVCLEQGCDGVDRSYVAQHLAEVQRQLGDGL